MTFVFKLFYILVFVILPVNAYAATADSLKAAIQSSLDRKKNVAELRDIEVTYEGQLLVEDAGGYYAVTLPDITIKSAGRSIDLGIISLNAAPTDKENVWRIRLALPTPMRFVSDDEKVHSRIHLPKQNIEAFWHSEADIYLSIDANFNDVKIEDFDKKTAVDLGAVQINNSVTGLDVEKISAHLEKMEAWAAKVIENGTDVKALDKDTLNSMFSMYMSDYIRSQDFSLVFEKMQSQQMDYDHAEGVEKLIQKGGADRIEFSTGFVVKDDNKIDLQGKAGALGIKSKDTQEVFALGAPDSFETAFTISDIPEKEVTNALKEYIEELLLGAKEQKTAEEIQKEKEMSIAERHEKKLQHTTNVYGLQLASDNAFVINVIQAAVKAGSKLGLKLTVSEEGQYGVTGELNVEGSPGAKHGGIGNLFIKLSGYDKVKEAALGAAKQKAQEAETSLNAVAEEENIEQTEAANKKKKIEKNAKLVFSIMEMIGKSSANENGGSDISFDARVGEDGNMTLNGLPVQQIMQMVLPVIMMNSMGDATMMQPAPNATTPPAGNPAIDPTMQGPNGDLSAPSQGIEQQGF